MLETATVKLVLTKPMRRGNEYVIYTLCDLEGYKYMKVLEYSSDILSDVSKVASGYQYLV